MCGTCAASLMVMVVSLWCGAVQAGEPSQRAKNNIAAMERILPGAEKAAEDAEKALQGIANSSDPKVISAVDSCRLRIDSTRSIRKTIAAEPDHFAWNGGRAWLEDLKEGMNYYVECSAAGKDGFAGMGNGVRARRSASDGHMLFYEFKLPRNFDAGKRYPLRVDLHYGSALRWTAAAVRGKPVAGPVLPALFLNPVQRLLLCLCAAGIRRSVWT